MNIGKMRRRMARNGFGRDETENIGTVVEMKMEGKHPRGRPRLRWEDSVRRDMIAWTIREEWATDMERWKGLCKTCYPAQGNSGKRRTNEK